MLKRMRVLFFLIFFLLLLSLRAKTRHAGTFTRLSTLAGLFIQLFSYDDGRPARHLCNSKKTEVYVLNLCKRRLRRCWMSFHTYIGGADLVYHVQLHYGGTDRNLIMSLR